MSLTDRVMCGPERQYTCWVPAAAVGPLERGQWWKAVDGSGWRGHGQAEAMDSPWEPVTLLTECPGASAGTRAGFLYLVETDIPPESEAEFNAWYDTEHLPGLSQVSGTVRARRYRRMRGDPLYMACYELVTPAAMESPAWLAVRNTPWSSRMRPLFRNTRRTLHAFHATSDT